MRLSILTIVCIFPFVTGCGLMPPTQIQEIEEQYHHVKDKTQKQHDMIVHNKQQERHQPAKKLTRSHLFEQIKDGIVTVSNIRKKEKMKHIKLIPDISIKGPHSHSKKNHPKPGQISLLSGLDNIGNQNSNGNGNINGNGHGSDTNNGIGNGNGSDNGNNSNGNQKHEEAQKKANELKNTDQIVTADQGNVYQEAVETSNVVLQVVKGQKVHVENTQVDKDENEIWCYVKGNDGKNDFEGWVSYTVLQL